MSSVAKKPSITLPRTYVAASVPDPFSSVDSHGWTWFYFHLVYLGGGGGRDVYVQNMEADSNHDTNKNNLPILFCLLGYICEQIYVLVDVFVVIPYSGRDFREIRVPLNINFTLWVWVNCVRGYHEYDVCSTHGKIITIVFPPGTFPPIPFFASQTPHWWMGNVDARRERSFALDCRRIVGSKVLCYILFWHDISHVSTVIPNLVYPTRLWRRFLYSYSSCLCPHITMHRSIQCAHFNFRMLQYLYFRTQPFDADDHAMRRNHAGAFIFYHSIVFSLRLSLWLDVRSKRSSTTTPLSKKQLHHHRP